MPRKYKYLTIADRRAIAEMHQVGTNPREIAEKIGVHPATIYRELARGVSGGYDPEQAQRAVKSARARRGRPRRRRGEDA